jgi:hypothetical protein
MTAFAQTSTPITRDANGVMKKTETHTFSAPEGSEMLSSITMIAIGVIGTRMAINYKPMTTDVMVAAVGAASFIAAEVMTNLKIKNTMETMTATITKSSDGKNDQAQIDHLVELKKSYEEARDATETKKKFQLVAAAAFAGAAAMAVYYSFQEDMLQGVCEKTIATAQTSLTTCVTTGTAAAATIASTVGTAAPALYKAVDDGKSCATCTAEMANYLKDLEIAQKYSKLPKPSAAVSLEMKKYEITLNAPACKMPGFTNTAMNSAVSASCQPLLTSNLFTRTMNPAPEVAKNENNFLNQILFGSHKTIANYELFQSSENYSIVNQAINFILPQAEASWLPMMGLAGGAAASYLLIKGPLAAAIDTQMYVPMRRGIVFGVLAGLSYMASKSSQDQIDKINANIENIDKILAELNNLKNGVNVKTAAEQQLKMQSVLGITNPEIAINPNPNVKMDCIGSSGNTNCKALDLQSINGPSLSGVPELKSIATTAANLGNGMSGVNTMSSATLANANNLLGKQNAISKLLAKAQSNLNEQLISSGKPAIDFAGEQKNLLNSWNKQTAKSLKAGGMSAGAFLASIGGTPIAGALAEVSKPAIMPAMKSGGASSGGGSSGGGSSAKDKTFNLDFKEAGAVAGDAGVKAEDSSSGKFDIGKNDINTNSDESIFQLISNRYLKSGYPKLLEEIPVKK